MRKRTILFWLVFACIHCAASQCYCCDEFPIACMDPNNGQDNPLVVAVGEPVSFTDNGSRDPDGGDLIDWSWCEYCGEDDWQELASGYPFTAISFDEPGLHEIRYFVKDNEGWWSDGWIEPSGPSMNPGGYDVCWINALANPLFEDVTICYDKAGFSSHSFNPSFLDTPQFDGVKYDPSYPSWCAENHITSQGRKFEHSHFPSGFPFSYDLDGNGTKETIYASDCDAFYEDMKYPSQYYTLVSSATCEENCHGFATGKGVWINGDAMSTILQDDYVEVFGANIPGAAFWTEGGDSPNHSVKITV